MTLLRYISVLMIALAGAACSSKPEKPHLGDITSLDDCPVIARKIPFGGDTLTVVDINKADSTIVLKLTDLAEDLRFIRLENSNSAYVADGITWVSGNRIIVYTDGVVRRFDMDGNFLGRVGDRGHGPGHYTIGPSEVYVDEEAERIYLVQPGTYNIVMYDANDGSFIRNIPMPYKLQKGRIHVDTENQLVTVAAAPFKFSGQYAGIWTQDFKGRIKSSVTRRNLAVNPDYSTEVYSGLATSPSTFDYSVFSTVARADTLYSYRDGKLYPIFTANWGKHKLPIHEYRSTPEFLSLILLANPKHVDKSADSIPALTPLIVDRKSLRGNFAHLMLDNLGTIMIKTNWLQQSTPDNFVMTFVPMELYDLIKEAPQSHEGIGEQLIKSMNELRDSIHPKDNNYVLIGKWKRPTS